MANIKSAKKRALIDKKNNLRNTAFKSSVKTAVKKVLTLAKEQNVEALKEAVSKAYQLCDKGVSKGILHKNTAARKKSRLTLAVNKLLKVEKPKAVEKVEKAAVEKAPKKTAVKKPSAKKPAVKKEK